MIRLHAVEGHDEARLLLARAHRAAGLPASLLFHGFRGVGKQRMALWTAQLQVCESPEDSGPCDRCRSCRMALGLEHPDVHWFFPLTRPTGLSGDRLANALESERIDQLAEIRQQPLRPSLGDELRGLYLGMVQTLRRRAHMAPSMSESQTFIVADAELLVPQESSQEAANALLKMLEEPPPSTRFILTSSEPGRLLPTIRSRSVPVHLGPLRTDQVAAFLEEHRGVDSATARWAAALGSGSIGRAMGFLPESDGEQGPLETWRRSAYRLVEAALSDGRAEGWLVALDEKPRSARGMVELFYFVEEWLRDVAAVAAGTPGGVLNQDALEHLEAMVRSSGVGPADTAVAVRAVEEARELARGNVNPQLIVSGLIRRLRRDLRPRRTPTLVQP